MGKKKKAKAKTKPNAKLPSRMAEQLASVTLLQASDVTDSSENTSEVILADVAAKSSSGVSMTNASSRRAAAMDDASMLAFWEDEAASLANDPLPNQPLQKSKQQTRAVFSPAQDERLQYVLSERDALESEKIQLQSELQEMRALLARERERSQRFARERDDARQAMQQAEVAYTPVSGAMSQRGLPERFHGDALSALATAHSDELLPLLFASQASLRGILGDHIALCCGHPECQDELQRLSSRQVLHVEEEASCENCQGSDNRRAFRRMVRMCRENRRYRMIVVGGSPDAHAELERLTPDGFIQRIVTGKERRNKQQATEDLRRADILVVWGPTILPHKISELYTKQKEAHPEKVVLVLKRGVASFAREVCTYLEGLK